MILNQTPIVVLQWSKESNVQWLKNVRGMREEAKDFNSVFGTEFKKVKTKV